MNFVGCIPRFFKAHGGWVLTALGTLGLAGTVILTAKEAPEAESCLEEELCHKLADVHEQYRQATGMPFNQSYTLPDEWYDKVDLTFWEKVKIAVPIYLPAILTGAGTLACFWGSQIFNARKQTALVAAYGALALQFDQYREAIRAEHGDEADKRAYEVSRAEVKRLRGELAKLKKENAPSLYEFAWLPGIVFETYPQDVSNAFMHFNRNMQLRVCNDLAEMCDMVGLPDDVYNKEELRKWGWQEYENDAGFGICYVDFRFLKTKDPSGREVNIIYSDVPPYELDVDYGFEGNVGDHLCPWYDLNLAKKCIVNEDCIQTFKTKSAYYAPESF